MHSIRIKITLITIAAILTSVFAVVIAGFLTIRTESERNATEKANLLCDNTKDMLDDYFDSIAQSVKMEATLATDSLSNMELVKSGVITGSGSNRRKQTKTQKDTLDNYLGDYCHRLQEVFGSVAGCTQGVVTYFYCVNPEISESEHGFFYSKVGKTGFEEQEPLDAREFDPNDLNHYTWYYTPIYKGRPCWVGPYNAHFLGEMVLITYVAPIYKAGNLIGVMGMDIPFDTIVSQISPIKVYKSGYACLLDEAGRVLYHPDYEFGSKPDISEGVLETIVNETSSGAEPIRFTNHGEEKQMSFATLNNGMKLLIIMPTKEVYATWTRLSHVILAFTIIIVAVFAVLVMFGMGIIIAPLQRLTAASRRLAAGDYDLELPYSGKDEVGTLTEAFSQMRDHLKQYISDLNRRIYTDDLTGLPNKYYFYQLADKARDALIADGKNPVLLYFNLIGIKYYNRQYTYAEGDKLLCDVARIMARCYGREHSSHFGQGHYVIITDEEYFKETYQTIIEKCQNANGGNGLPVRVGVYPYSMGEIDINIACDRAKYASERQRDSYLSNCNYFSDEMYKKIENSRYIINNLDQALDEGWIKVYYQPIICAKTGKISDEEALARWFDPDKGYISPGVFIPVLEGSRQIYKLDLYVLDQILMKMQKQMDAGLFVAPHSLNLSRIDFDECDIIEEIIARVDKAGIPREKLTIEITESVVGSDFDFIKEKIEQLQKLGFQVWMDDFGSGYSSLDVLQDIHFDLIKFDMRFMHRLREGDDKETRIILTQLFKMAEDLDIETVAEGVEMKEQVDFLKEVGCTRLQGFYYSKAIPMEEIIEKYESNIETNCNGSA